MPDPRDESAPGPDPGADTERPALDGHRSPRAAIIETAKTLVVAYGPREAARQLNLPSGTVQGWAMRYRWKQAQPILNQSGPAEALAASIRSHKSRSTIALARYAAEAAEAAADLPDEDKLGSARRVRDVAAVHSTLWPHESTSTILDIQLLTGESGPKQIVEAEGLTE